MPRGEQPGSPLYNSHIFNRLWLPLSCSSTVFRGYSYRLCEVFWHILCTVNSFGPSTIYHHIYHTRVALHQLSYISTVYTIITVLDRGARTDTSGQLECLGSNISWSPLNKYYWKKALAVKAFSINRSHRQRMTINLNNVQELYTHFSHDYKSNLINAHTLL